MRSVTSFLLRSSLIVAVFLFSTDKAYAQTTDNDSYVTGLTSDRAKSLIGVAAGLASLIIGWRVKSRSAAKASTWRPWVIAALLLGMVAVVLSAFHLASVDGGFGTGGGKAGAIVALILGFIGASLSGMAMYFKLK
jgi:hypothetical protein